MNLAEEMANNIERLASLYGTDPWTEEITLARQEYELQRGPVYQEDAIFETHVAIFIEWYLLERRLSLGISPVVARLRQTDSNAGESKIWRALALSHRSLFEVVDALPNHLLLNDLIRESLWRIDQDPPFDGIDPGDIFEARLIPWEGRVIFGPAFCFHPRQARDSIHAFLRHKENEGQISPELISTLATMRLKHDRFQTMPVERVYTQEAIPRVRTNPG